MPVQISKHLFTVREFHDMARAGVFEEDDRVELIAGEVIEMTPIGSRHAGSVNRLTAVLTAQLGASAVVSVQNPIILDDYWEPQPDVVVLRPRADFYAEEHPIPADILLVIEVSDTSVEYDRRTKLPHYARRGVPEAWILDLQLRCIDRYDRPSAEGYQQSQRFASGDRITSGQLAALDIPVSELIG